MAKGRVFIAEDESIAPLQCTRVQLGQGSIEFSAHVSIAISIDLVALIIK